MIRADRYLPSTAVSSWLNYGSTAVTASPPPYTPVWEWDFTTQGNSGWTTGTYTSSGGGGPTITWQTTYYDIWSGTDGPAANYSSASATRTQTITSSSQLVVYIDAAILNSGGTLGASIGLTQVTSGGRNYPNLSRRAIKVGVSNATVNDTQVSVSSVSAWSSGQTTQGRIYLYGIYIGLNSDDTRLQSYLTQKGLTIY